MYLLNFSIPLPHNYSPKRQIKSKMKPEVKLETACHPEVFRKKMSPNIYF